MCSVSIGRVKGRSVLTVSKTHGIFANKKILDEIVFFQLVFQLQFENVKNLLITIKVLYVITSEIGSNRRRCG